MNGHALCNANIAVDYWKVVGIQKTYVHFLTHLHGDHIVGLTSSWTRPIYCSEITAMLLEQRHGISKQLLRILPLHESIVVETKSGSFSVMAFDANHCPGAIMLYFQGSFGSIFYTGDFRSSAELIENCCPMAMNADVLYLDNTFCDPRCTFPSRSECLTQILDIIRLHAKKKIVIGVRKLGKEAMLGELGAELNEMIVVSPQSYKLCCELFETNVFTTPYDPKGSRIWTVPMNYFKRKAINGLGFKEAVFILPTAMFTGLEKQPYHSDVYVVPYSDHSSYPELVEFVSAMSPRSIRPIVEAPNALFGESISNRANMSCFDAFLAPPTSLPQSQSLEDHQEESSALLVNHQVDCVYGIPVDHAAPNHSALGKKKAIYKRRVAENETNEKSTFSSNDKSKLESFLSLFGKAYTQLKVTRQNRKTKRASRPKAQGVVFIEEDNSSPVEDSSASLMSSSERQSSVASQHALENSRSTIQNVDEFVDGQVKRVVHRAVKKDKTAKIRVAVEGEEIRIGALKVENRSRDRFPSVKENSPQSQFIIESSLQNNLVNVAVLPDKLENSAVPMFAPDIISAKANESDSLAITRAAAQEVKDKLVLAIKTDAADVDLKANLIATKVESDVKDHLPIKAIISHSQALPLKQRLDSQNANITVPESASLSNGCVAENDKSVDDTKKEYTPYSFKHHDTCVALEKTEESFGKVSCPCPSKQDSHEDNPNNVGRFMKPESSTLTTGHIEQDSSGNQCSASDSKIISDIQNEKSLHTIRHRPKDVIINVLKSNQTPIKNESLMKAKKLLNITVKEKDENGVITISDSDVTDDEDNGKYVTFTDTDMKHRNVPKPTGHATTVTIRTPESVRTVGQEDGSVVITSNKDCNVSSVSADTELKKYRDVACEANLSPGCEKCTKKRYRAGRCTLKAKHASCFVAFSSQDCVNPCTQDSVDTESAESDFGDQSCFTDQTRPSSLKGPCKRHRAERLFSPESRRFERALLKFLSSSEGKAKKRKTEKSLFWNG